MRKTLTSLLLLICIISCQKDTQNKSQIDRPIDPWVFRSVLDQNPRMITAALNKDLYVSYFTQTGSLYKAWKGIVNFEGAVFDGAHGPQPTSVGDAYLIQEKDFPTWQVFKDSNQVDFKYNYLGHRFNDGDFELMHSFILDDNSQITVNEKVSYEKSESGTILFIRTYNVNDLPVNFFIINNSSATVVDKSQIKSNAELTFSDKEEKVIEDASTFIRYNFSTKIQQEEVSLSVPFSKALYEDPNIDDGFGDDKESLPDGAILIGKHDCKTCHNKSKKTVGPSYVDIAKKYEHTDENIQSLVNKIKLGGSGIWGEQVMTPHPEVSNYDLTQMVSYVFTLADFEGQATKTNSDNLEAIPSAAIDENKLIPGAVTRIYSIEKTALKIPTDLDKRKPIQAGVLQNFDNISGGDFKELEDNFALKSTGFLEIKEDGIYNFRLWSDDGSKMYLHDKEIIDHDGHHGTSMKQAQLNLKKGFHPFRIEFFQGGGGKFLSLNFKPEKEKYWAVVPPSLISHNVEDQSNVELLSLPMSVITKIPGDAEPLQDVHPSFDLAQARPDDFQKKIGGLDFLSDGRMVVSCWDTEGGVYILENTDSGDQSKIVAKKIASGLAEPLGVKVVNDRIFVMQKQEITELIDSNDDDVIDEYRTLCDDWGVSSNFHEFGFGLEEKDGYLYANLATGIMPGGAGMVNQHIDRGNCIKVSIEDGSIEFVANGLRTPNGIGKGYNGELFIADNQGDWLPSSKILHVSKDAWFGSRAVDFEGTKGLKEKKPVVWLPQDEIGNSPSTPSYLNVGPYKNQMIHGEVTHGGIKRVFVEEVEGELQGCVFRFIQGLEAGVNRIQWGPDGALYAGGIGNPGNWQHNSKLWYGLQRLEYNEKSTFEMLSVNAKTNGIEITFTEPLKPGDGLDKYDYEVRQWYYLPTKEYGGPKLDDRALDVRSVNVSDDRTKVFLELEGMKDNHVIYLRLKNHFVSENEHSLWTTESWYTMNQIPKNKPGFKTRNLNSVKANTLSDYEKENGWELLFDGKSLNSFHSYNSDVVNKFWKIEGDAIKFDPQKKGNGSDLVTNDTYEDFEFQLEWKISNCGNSGIMFNVQERDSLCCPYLTGPEMQILDNTCHPDTRFVTHRAGDLYDMIETKYTTVNQAGEWNKIRIVSKEGKVSFWQNGYEVVKFEMHNAKWEEMIENSKFKDWPEFGKYKSGHIVLQDHDDVVWFRNVKIKNLKAN
ncbi:MAG: DUF1080 domain-containing protein [Saprospiraceae bacterium]|nr:DUF1080 domain-containing protein [Saprospiraceae bacterium]